MKSQMSFMSICRYTTIVISLLYFIPYFYYYYILPRELYKSSYNSSFSPLAIKSVFFDPGDPYIEWTLRQTTPPAYSGHCEPGWVSDRSKISEQHSIAACLLSKGVQWKITNHKFDILYSHEKYETYIIYYLSE